MTFRIDHDQAGGGDLVEHQAVGIEQEAVLLTRQARRQMSEDEIVHAKMGEQAVGRGEIAADLPFLRIDVTRGELLNWVQPSSLSGAAR